MSILYRGAFQTKAKKITDCCGSLIFEIFDEPLEMVSIRVHIYFSGKYKFGQEFIQDFIYIKRDTDVVLSGVIDEDPIIFIIRMNCLNYISGNYLIKYASKQYNEGDQGDFEVNVPLIRIEI